MKLIINEPCQQDWKKMTASGYNIGMYTRHCDSCEKNVVDFTQNSRAEIITYMLSNRDNSVCGRMRVDQFDFRHEDIPILLDTLDRQKTVNPFLVLALVCMSLSACSQEEVNTINTPPATENHIKIGKMIAAPVKAETTDVVTPHCIEVEQGEILLGNVESPIEESKHDPDNKIHKYTSTMPEFPGGIGKMTLFIDENKLSPTTSTLSGTVYVRFVVEADGNITQIEIVRSLHDSLDQEAIRIIKLMPNWIPGKKEDKKVPVYMTIPVRF